MNAIAQFQHITAPTDSDTSTIFSTVTAFPGQSRAAAGQGCGHFRVDVKHSHGAILKLSKSLDRGANWHVVTQGFIPVPLALQSTVREFDVSPFADFKLEVINGGTTQTTWAVDMSLTPLEGRKVPPLWEQSRDDPASQVWKRNAATTAQTGADVWDPASGARIAVTRFTVATYDSTAATGLVLWFGDNADTTYTAGTDQVLHESAYAPTAGTTAPGYDSGYMPVPVFCTTADRELHITTDTAIDYYVNVYGFEW